MVNTNATNQEMTDQEIKSVERSVTNDRRYLQGCDDDHRVELVHRIRKQSAYLKKLKEKYKK